MRRNGHHYYEGKGNCLIHALLFRARYGGKIVVGWNRRKNVPTFRVEKDVVKYVFRPFERTENPFWFAGRTVKK